MSKKVFRKLLTCLCVLSLVCAAAFAVTATKTAIAETVQSKAITINTTATKRGVGDTVQLKATVSAGETVKWYTSDKTVATVTQTGKVSMVNVGTAVITAKSSNGTSATCNVTVAAAPTSITITPRIVYMEVGKTATIKMAYNSGAAGGYKVTNSKPAVASLSQTNATTITMTGTNVGVTTVTFTSYNGVTASVKVGVYNSLPSKVTLSASSIKRGVGNNFTLKATYSSDPATKLTWKSSNKKVATVDAAGNVKLLSAGTAKITATAVNGVSAACDVTVTPAPTSITTNKTVIYMEKGKTATLKMGYNEGAAGTYTVKSSKPAVADITKNTATSWTITGKNVGVTTYTFTSYNGLTATCKVGVYDKLPSKVTLDTKSYTSGVGDYFYISAEYTSSPSTKLTWKSSDTKVAKVEIIDDDFVKVKLVGVGTATITAKAVNGVYAKCNVKVGAAPTKINIGKVGNMDTYSSKTIKLSYGSASELGQYTVTSSDTSVVSVTKAGFAVTLQSHKAGTATITVTAYNGKSASVKVEVVDLAHTYHLEVYSGPTPGRYESLYVLVPYRYHSFQIVNGYGRVMNISGIRTAMSEMNGGEAHCYGNYFSIYLEEGGDSIITFQLANSDLEVFGFVTQ